MADDPTRAAMQMALEALTEVSDLIGQSQGVYGLHLNGDPAPWDELCAGGRFEWLPKLEDATAALRASLALPAEGAEPPAAVATLRVEQTAGGIGYDVWLSNGMWSVTQPGDYSLILAATPHPPQGRGAAGEGGENNG